MDFSKVKCQRNQDIYVVDVILFVKIRIVEESPVLHESRIVKVLMCIPSPGIYGLVRTILKLAKNVADIRPEALFIVKDLM